MPNVIGPVASVHQEVQSQFQVLDPEKCALMKGNGYWICLKRATAGTGAVTTLRIDSSNRDGAGAIAAVKKQQCMS
jgi:hypothetical protein